MFEDDAPNQFHNLFVLWDAKPQEEKEQTHDNDAPFYAVSRATLAMVRIPDANV